MRHALLEDLEAQAWSMDGCAQFVRHLPMSPPVPDLHPWHPFQASKPGEPLQVAKIASLTYNNFLEPHAFSQYKPELPIILTPPIWVFSCIWGSIIAP